MIQRCIYFVQNNALYHKTFEVDTDYDNPEISRVMQDSYLQINPRQYGVICDINGVTTPNSYGLRFLSLYNTRVNGKNYKDVWDEFTKKSKGMSMPPGCHELLYLQALSYEQEKCALSYTGFYDCYHDPRTDRPTPAKALCAYNMLYYQGKLDYIQDTNMFLHWWYANCYTSKEFLKEK